MIEIRTFTYIDILQPQLAAFIATVCQGYFPLEEQASLFIEVAPGIAINRITDRAMKSAQVYPGMQIVERAFGLLELHSFSQGEIRAAGEAVLSHVQAEENSRLKPKVLSSQIITGIDGHQAMLINRMRHGQFLLRGETLYILEVEPAGYAAIAANEAEKAAPINLLEMRAFGAFGRLFLGGRESEIQEAAKAVESTLSSIAGRSPAK
jgi:hypothetical protein